MLDATVPEPRTSTRILVVDPDSDTRVRHAMMLQPVTPDIEEADDGAEALGRALASPGAQRARKAAARLLVVSVLPSDRKLRHVS